MRILSSLFLSLLLTVSALADTLFQRVTVLTQNGDEAIENAYVHIKGDRIHYVGTEKPTMEAGGEITIVNGYGKFLIPGLAEMHGHLPQGSATSQIAKDTLFLYLAGGVTTVRGMLGNPVQFEMRDKIKAGELDGPTLYLAAPSLNGNSVSSPENGAAQVRRYKQDGWDLLKIHPGLTKDEYDAIADTAHEVGIPFGGHVPADVGLAHALDRRQISIDHIDGFLELLDGYSHRLSDEEIATAVKTYSDRFPSWIVPTQPLFNLLIGGGDAEAFASLPEVKYMTPDVRASWHSRLARINMNPNQYVKDNRTRMLAALYKAGARIVMGSDAPQLYSVPGFSIWREIDTLIEADISARDILAIGTKNAGDYFADKDNFGTVSNGARADLIMLNKDPRINAQNLFNQAGVMAAGRWYSRKEIDNRLAEIASRNSG